MRAAAWPSAEIRAWAGAAVPVVPVERVASLDALRGLCALAVAVYHLAAWTRAFEGDARSAIVVLGVYAVESFFLISGFCFFHHYGQERFDARSIARFHVKRFFRIAPLYYCAVLLGAACGLDQSVGPRVDAARVVENLTLSFGFFHPNHSMVLGGWSIGVEYVFYLAFPLLVWVTRARAVLYGLALLLVLWALPHTFGAVQAERDPYTRFHAYVALPNQAFLFLLGAIVADLRARVAWRLPPALVLASLALMLWAAGRAQPPLSDHLEVMVGAVRVKYVALTALVVLLCAFIRDGGATALRPLERLGDISYSLYLMHPFAWLLVERLTVDRPPLLRVACGLLAALAFAAVTRACIERPLQKWGQTLAR